MGACASVVVKALRYTPEGRGFEFDEMNDCLDNVGSSTSTNKLPRPVTGIAFCFFYIYMMFVRPR
jgi:hypothetical protein